MDDRLLEWWARDHSDGTSLTEHLIIGLAARRAVRRKVDRGDDRDGADTQNAAWPLARRIYDLRSVYKQPQNGLYNS